MRAEQFFFGNPFESEFDLPPGFMGGVAVQEQEQEQEQQEETTPAFTLPSGGDSNLDALVDSGLFSNLLTIDYGVPALVGAAGNVGMGTVFNPDPTQAINFLTGSGSSGAAAGAAGADAAAGGVFGLNPLTSAYLLYNVGRLIGKNISGKTDPLTKELSRLVDIKPGTGGPGRQQKTTIEFDTQLKDFATQLVAAGWNPDRSFINQVQEGDPELLDAFYKAADSNPRIVQYFVDRFGEGIFDRPSEDIAAAEQEEATVSGIDGTDAFVRPPFEEETPTTTIAIDDVLPPTVVSTTIPDESITVVETPPDTPLDVITDDVTLDDTLEAIEVDDFEEDIAPPTFTQEQVDAQIAEAVSGATQGLLTQEQADAATQAAIDALPEDTTEFNQADIDSAVSSAVQEVESAFAEERTGFESTIESLESLGQEAETQRQEEIAGYQTSITELENALTNLENRKELAIRSGDERLAETIADYEQQIKDRLAEAEQTFSEERGTLESQLEEEQQEITELESTVTALRGALETSKTTASDLRTTLESTQTALQEQQEITQAKESDIEGLTTSVNTLTGTVSSLETKITEVTAAKDKAIADGDQKLADAMANAEATLEATKAEAEETLQNAIAAGETKAADAVAAGQAAVADAVAAGEAAVASAVAQGQADVEAATVAGEAAAAAAEAAGREEGFGEGLGQGRGEGVGAGTGLGLALGLGAGMLQPQSVTKTMFEDFEFEKKYEAPEILAGLTGLPVYQAPKIGLFQGLI